jgi:Zinc-ribbon containing domain
MSTRHTEETQDTFASLYERCLKEIQQRLRETTTLTTEVLQVAAERVRESLSHTQGVSQDDLNRVIATIIQQGQRLFTSGEHLRPEVGSHETVQAWTERGVALLADLAGAVKSFAGEVESQLQRELEYHTGTVVGAGNFFCTRCDKPLQKVKAGPLPPCSRCHGTVFRRRL